MISAKKESALVQSRIVMMEIFARLIGVTRQMGVKIMRLNLRVMTVTSVLRVTFVMKETV